VRLSLRLPCSESSAQGGRHHRPIRMMLCSRRPSSLRVMSGTPESRAYRVVIADDTYLIREGLRQVLEGEDGVDIVAYASSLPTLLREVSEQRPDVVITDIRMPPTNTDEGILAAAELQESDPPVGVVVISNYVSPHYVLRLFEHGSAGTAYLLKENIGHRERLMEAIRAVASGGSVVDPAVVDVLVEARLRARNSRLTDLTTREREVLARVAQGKSNAAIATELFLTKRAIEKNINSIFSKLNLVNDTEISQRVAATLLYLADTPASAPETVSA
jgi:DNA-binding NarL/FixJ family response regulator